MMIIKKIIINYLNKINKIDKVILFFLLLLYLISWLYIGIIAFVLSNYFFIYNFLTLLICHGLYIIMGFIILLITMIFPITIIEKYITYICIVVMGLLISVLLFGPLINGTHRWLRIKFLTIQPSALLLCFSPFINSYFLKTKKYNLSAMFLCCSLLLIILEPDFGVSLIFLISWSIQHIANNSFVLYIPMLIVVVGIFFILLNIYGMYVIKRIINFIMGNNNDQLYFALNSIGSSKPWDMNLTYIPDMHNDFLLSGFFSYFGYCGGIVLILLIFFILIRLLNNIINNNNKYYINISLGLWSIIFTQVALHFLSNFGIIPPKGMSLPLLSYGGSFIICNSAMFGFLLNLNKINYQMIKQEILITTGGTGGHVIPACVFFDYCVERGQAVKICSNYGSSHLIGDKKDVLYLNSYSKYGFIRICKIFVNIFKSLSILKNIHTVICFGTYNSVPLLIGAIILRKKIILHETNAILSRVNKIFRFFAYKVCISLPISKKYNNIVHTGMPLRKEFFNIKENNNNKFIILIVGGSLLSDIFDDIIPKIINKIPKNLLDNIEVIHCSKKSIIHKYSSSVKIKNLIGFVPDLYKYFNCNLIISRGGAATIYEIGYLNKNALIIPWNNAINNHQYHNSKILLGNNQLVCLEQDIVNSYDKILRFVIRIMQNPINYPYNKNLYPVNSCEKILDLLKDS